MIYLSALMLGLFGSFHCVGMCGPIAIAIPLNNKNMGTRIAGGLAYNLGRTITYGIMGAIFGLIGEGLQLGGFQRWVSIIMGVVMVVSVLFPSLLGSTVNLDKNLYSFVGKVKLGLRNLLQKRSMGALLGIGLLNGLLPCGLVYMAIAGAIAAGGFFESSLFMIIFGLGTIPMLLVISLLGNMASVKIRKKMSKAIPVVVVIIGILFILRGLNLGIPFISPPEKKLKVNTQSEMMMESPMHNED